MASDVTKSTTTAAARVRLAALLGHPQKLSTSDVAERRYALAGCPVEITSATHGTLVNVLGSTFAVNLCGLVVAELVAALNISGLTGDDASSEALWESWQHSELGSSTEGLWTAAASDGQAFLVVSRRADGRPEAWVNSTYDGTQGIEVQAVNADGRLVLCVRHETETLVKNAKTGLLERVWDYFRRIIGQSTERAAVQYVERKIRTEYAYNTATDSTMIRYFVTDPGSAEYQAREVDGQWQPADGQGEEWPWGFPVIPFVSPNGGELTDLAGPQRMVNAAALDLATAARIDALRIIWLRDLAPLKPATSGASKSSPTPEPLTIRPGLLLQLQSPNPDQPGAIGSIPPADLGSLMEAFRLRARTLLMLGRASTFMMSWDMNGVGQPSGAALMIANSPFRDKVARYQESWGVALQKLLDVWARMMDLSARDVHPAWAPINWQTMAERLANAQAMQLLSLPLSERAAELGLDPDRQQAWQDELDAIKAEREAMLQAMGEAPSATQPPAV